MSASGSGSGSGWWPPRSRCGSRVVGGEVGVVEFLHRERVGEEPGARDAVGDPEVDRAVDGEPDDVVG